MSIFYFEQCVNCSGVMKMYKMSIVTDFLMFLIVRTLQPY